MGYRREGQLHMLSSPSQMVSLCDKLNDNQRTAVKEIGFEGLLLLRIKMSIMVWLSTLSTNTMSVLQFS